jgi:glycosyltransferase involved in cell wall biosynthesis
MKIVFTSYVSAPDFNDPEAWLKRIDGYVGILEALAQRHEVIAIERINFEGMVKRKSVHYYFLRQKGKAYFHAKMHRFIKSLKPDIVFVNGLIFPLQVIQLGLVLGKATKIVTQNHAEKPGTGLKRILQRIADRYIRTYFFTAKEMGLKWLGKGIIRQEKKLVEVMEASSSFTVMEKQGALSLTQADGNPNFLWVGRLDQNKDPVNVVKAFLEFAKHQTAARLYMIFHTTELLNEVEEVIKTNRGENFIKLIGKLPHQDMQAWYNSADYIISGSHYEGSGIAVCEAMSCGCIPIVTNITSFHKMTGYGRCGLLYDTGNRAALLKALQQTSEMNMESEKKKVLIQFEEELSFKAIASSIEESII